MFSAGVRRTTRAWTLLVLVFLYAPLLLVLVNAFNRSKSFAFPPSGFTLQWWKAHCTARACGGRWPIR